MSILKFSGNLFGTGSVTITSPNTNATYSITLPASSGELVSTGNFNTGIVTEGTNLYFTNARVIAAVSDGLSTSNIAEGSNLYFTNARVAANVALLSINVLYDVDTTNAVAGNALVWNGSTWVPGTVAAGSASTALTSNFATLAANANLVVSISNFTTSNLAEGNNLYYTNARVRSAITAGNTLYYDQTTGNVTLTRSGVTVGVYGNSSTIAVVTVDQFGRVTNAQNTVVSSSAVAASGSDRQIQYNNAGSFAGASSFTFDGSNVTIGNAGQLRFANTNSTRYVSFRANTVLSANVTWTLPGTDGSANSALLTDGSGNLSFGRSANSQAAAGLFENSNLIVTSYTIREGYNAISAGPIGVAPGVTVTVPAGSTWLVL